MINTCQDCLTQAVSREGPRGLKRKASLSKWISGPVHTTPKEFENGGFTLKTHQMFFVHTRKQIKRFPSTLRQRNLKTQQSQAEETLECIRQHVHSKVLVEPTWQNQHGNDYFGRHFGFVFDEDSGRQITWLSWRHRFQKKLRFQNVFRPH